MNTPWALAAFVSRPMRALLLLSLLVPVGSAAADSLTPSVARPTVNPLDDTSLYPIAVWAMPAATAPAFADMGVNIFVAGGDDAGWCDTLAASGIAGYVHWRSNRPSAEAEAIARSPGFLGWMHGDEPDNPEVVDDVFLHTRHPPQALQRAYDEMRASSTPAPMYLNLGQGLANGLAQSTPDSLYPAFCRTADIVCYDVYPTSTQENGVERLHLTARGVERLRAFAGPDKPLWIWLACTDLNGSGSGRGNRAPYAYELRAEVWMSILHGADGIGYFAHQFNPYRGGPAAIPQALQGEMTRTNALLHALAPLLRTGTMQRLAVDTRQGQVSAVLWQQAGQSLLVAVNMGSQATHARLTVPPALAESLEPLHDAPTDDPAYGSAGASSLLLALRPYEVAVFTGGIEAKLIGDYTYPAPPVTDRPSPSPLVAHAIHDLPTQRQRRIAWSRTQHTRLMVPTLSAAPQLDGRLDDAAWRQSAPLTSWTNVSGEGAPELSTQGSIGVHGQRLYLAFHAEEPHLDSLVSRYDALWRNDCIELWFNADNRRTSFAHIIIAADGRIETERTLPDHWGEAWRDEGWAPRFVARSGRDASGWTLEMSVPLADLGIDGDAVTGGTAIAFDAARERKTAGGENSVWTRGGFRAAMDFGELTFGSGELILADGTLRN
ncbi:MAG: hypothetical protein O2782_21220, partial [bacterium]|nr:hypothetical protein [bacterium]